MILEEQIQQYKEYLSYKHKEEEMFIKTRVDYLLNKKYPKYDSNKLLTFEKAIDNYKPSIKDDIIIDEASIKKLKRKYEKKEHKLSKLEEKYNTYIQRCKEKNRVFELSYAEFCDILNKECAYCNDPSNSIDRIDSKKGYTKDNVQPCCYKCNVMKWTFTHDDFIQQIEKIYKKTKYSPIG